MVSQVYSFVRVFLSSSKKAIIVTTQSIPINLERRFENHSDNFGEPLAHSWIMVDCYFVLITYFLGV